MSLAVRAVLLVVAVSLLARFDPARAAPLSSSEFWSGTRIIPRSTLSFTYLSSAGDMYPDYALCVLSFVDIGENERVTFTVDSLDTENAYDDLKFLTNDGFLVNSFSGNLTVGVPLTVIVDGPPTVMFTSDSSIGGLGWSLSWTISERPVVVPKSLQEARAHGVAARALSEPCCDTSLGPCADAEAIVDRFPFRIEFPDPSNSFQGSSYSNGIVYKNNLACTWKFEPPRGKTVQLVMNSYDLGFSASDSVKAVFKDYTVRSWFGRDSFAATLVKAVDMLTFSSDSSSQHGGFVATVRLVDECAAGPDCACCEPSATRAGCFDKTVSTCVCAFPGLEYCCTNAWDAACVSAVDALSCGFCDVSTFDLKRDCSGAVKSIELHPDQTHGFLSIPPRLVPFSPRDAFPSQTNCTLLFNAPVFINFTLVSLEADASLIVRNRQVAAAIPTVGEFYYSCSDCASEQAQLRNAASLTETVIESSEPSLTIAVVTPPPENRFFGYSSYYASYAQGVRAFWRRLPDRCSGVRTLNPSNSDKSGVLAEPSSSAYATYSNDQFCEYIIAFPGSDISLTVTRLDLEQDFDVLTLFDGASQTLQLTGNSAAAIGTRFLSTTGVVRVRFSSDASVTGAGFELSWSATPAEVVIEGCIAGCLVGLESVRTVLAGRGLVLATDWVLLVDSLQVLPDIENDNSSLISVRALNAVDRNTPGTVSFSLGAASTYGYPSMSMYSASLNRNVSLSGFVYRDEAATFNCTAPGRWFQQGKCRSCPPGGFCPGGSRIWPHVQYWAVNERTEPARCQTADACCGALGELGETCPVSLLEGGARDTTLCNRQGGYAGQFCAQCIDGWYRDVGICLPCSDGQKGEFAGYLIAAGVILAILALGVSVVSVPHITAVLSAIMSVQQLIYVGRMASANLSGDTGRRLSDLFRVLSVLLFDVEFFKPNCFVSKTFDFIDLFWSMVVICVVATAVLCSFAIFYACFGYRTTLGHRKALASSSADTDAELGADESASEVSGVSPTESSADSASAAESMETSAATSEGASASGSRLSGISSASTAGTGTSASAAASANASASAGAGTFTSASASASATASASASAPTSAPASASASSIASAPTSAPASASASSIVSVSAASEQDEAKKEKGLVLLLDATEAVRNITRYGLSTTMNNTCCKRFRVRSKLACVLMMAFVHFQMTLRCFQAVACTATGAGGQNYLIVDQTIRCNTERHNVVYAVAVLLLIFYSLGFPLLALLLMTVAYRRRHFVVLKVQFAFLTRTLRLRAYWYRTIGFFLNILLAAQIAWIRSLSMRVFVASLSFLLNTLVAGWFSPFKLAIQNIVQMAVGLANAAQIIVLLSLNSTETGGSIEALRNALIVVAGLIAGLAILLFMHREGYLCFTKAPGDAEIDHIVEDAGAAASHSVDM